MQKKINIKKLIKEVEVRPALWNMNKKEYSDKVKRKECWEQIAAIFSDPVMTTDEKKKLEELLHKKWKNIRDRFARDISSKKRKYRDKSECKSPYMFTEQLQFLREVVISKRKAKSHTTQNEDEEHIVNTHPKNPNQYSLEESAFSTEENKHKELQKDDNYHFLLSLLPSLSGLTKALNLNCRIELMQIVAKYVSVSRETVPGIARYGPIIESSSQRNHNHLMQFKALQATHSGTEDLDDDAESDIYDINIKNETNL
ncbi:uncharacterized protein LOC119665896 [Teleopsis dalmanni]|uniref:uncharacterized protein LOC119665896 n=1 Tax=Teleopsis dalmanni TaxID=139649 RepID=UPI0018CF4DCF|nr:uncharacterized protein LOC119665896 [Teleopsis dalmanni]